MSVIFNEIRIQSLLKYYNRLSNASCENCTHIHIFYSVIAFVVQCFSQVRKITINRIIFSCERGIYRNVRCGVMCQSAREHVVKSVRSTLLHIHRYVHSYFVACSRHAIVTITQNTYELSNLIGEFEKNVCFLCLFFGCRLSVSDER